MRNMVHSNSSMARFAFFFLGMQFLVAAVDVGQATTPRTTNKTNTPTQLAGQDTPCAARQASNGTATSAPALKLRDGAASSPAASLVAAVTPIRFNNAGYCDRRLKKAVERSFDMLSGIMHSNCRDFDGRLRGPVYYSIEYLDDAKRVFAELAGVQPMSVATKSLLQPTGLAPKTAHGSSLLPSDPAA